jgi:hypothetical protein
MMMWADDEDFKGLAVRVRQGDAAAAAAMRWRLEPEMVRMVRQALQTGGGRPEMTQWILAEVDRTIRQTGTHFLADRERLIRRVARALCQWVIDRLRPHRPGLRPAEETVCGP